MAKMNKSLTAIELIDELNGVLKDLNKHFDTYRPDQVQSIIQNINELIKEFYVENPDLVANNPDNQ